MSRHRLLLAVWLGLYPPVASAEEPFLVQITQKHGRIVSYLEGRPIGRDTYRDLAAKHQIVGRYGEVIVIFRDNLPFRAVEDMKGYLQAVDFLNIKYFYVGDDNQRMGEISFVPGGVRRVPIDLK